MPHAAKDRSDPARRHASCRARGYTFLLLASDAMY